MTLASYITEVLADSPWGFWPMQETSGTSMADVGGGSHSGVYQSAVAALAGPFSDFTSVNMATNLATVAGVYQTNGVQAVEIWGILDPPGTTQSVAFEYDDPGQTVGWTYAAVQVAGSGPNAALGIHSPSTAWLWTAHPQFYSSVWSHSVLQFEADGHWRAYTRAIGGGRVVDDLGAHGLGAVSGASLKAGSDPATAYQFHGRLCAFAFYTHNLTTARIDAHFDAASAVGPPPPPCQYGTRKKATSPAVDLLTEAAITGILLAAGLTWWEVLLVVFAGQQIDVNVLCSSLPPQPPPPTPDALNYPPYKLLDYLYQNVWNYYCECIPGATTPVNPPTGTATKPTGMPDPRVIVVNPTNPCLDLTEVRRMLDAILRQLNIDVQMDTLLQRYSLPFATVRGATHSGLGGTGSFAISRLIGVQIAIVDRPPNRELEGAPNYVWDLGWISCMDGNGFIQERRITRDVEVWMPREFQEATILGYMFKTGVTANITELEAET